MSTISKKQVDFCWSNVGCEKESNDKNFVCKREKECNSGICVCKEGYILDGDRCFRELKIGEDCGRNHGMCVGRGVFCSDLTKKCVCLDGTKSTDDKRNCVPNEDTPVDAKCSRFCTDLNAVCEKDSHRCRCKLGYSKSLKGDCRLAEFQDICKLDYDCRLGMKCLFGECHCEDIDSVFVSSLNTCVHRKASVGNTNCTEHTTMEDSRLCSYGYRCLVCPFRSTGYCVKEAVKPTMAVPQKDISSGK
ncbi:DgyrCDS5394 [Dimorphilus gyrociliatus]|uniref:DgyrCDS5394 n=1 Tax=Dimorphilus gyrociliatus TaxID=2664684 RepID=A0A7I8VJR9_9ANNE|nr:DgyrCDS5394 [Dimorphilus gyrociliatus]